MSETRRLKIKIGDAEFEADVPENDVQLMYDRFLSMLAQRRTSLFRQNTIDNNAPKRSLAIETPKDTGRCSYPIGNQEPSDSDTLARVFDLRRDGTIVLKVLPKGPAQYAHTLLLLLYGYHRVKNEGFVLATDLYRSAEQSGSTIRRLASEYASNHRYVVRGGRGKGTNYSLNKEGLGIARDIIAKEIVAPIAETEKKLAIPREVPLVPNAEVPSAAKIATSRDRDDLQIVNGLVLLSNERAHQQVK
jgi:hypothetical protein